MANDRPTIINTAKQTLKDGGPVVVFSVFAYTRPLIIKIAQQTGYDMLLIDAEHVLHNEEHLTDFIVSARDNGLSPLVTVQTSERHFVSRILDAGALGVSLSHAETTEQVDEMVRWMKYPPVGERALGSGPSSDYWLTDAPRYLEEANAATMLALKIESRKGLENAEAMMSNEWVDVIVFGPGDLAIDMGFHGDMEHPEVVAAMERVIDLAISHGKAVEPAIGTADRATYQRQRERGIQIFGLTRHHEYALLREAAENAMEPFR